MISCKRPMPETEGNESLRKYKKTVYTTAGFTNDEIKLQFDDNSELFVSKCLLMYASPVFEMMLKSECKESKTQTIQLKGKKYEDMLELLRILDLRTPCNITDQNLFRVVPLAHEYQIDRLVMACETIILKYLLIQNKFNQQRIFKDVRKCMQFLKLADLYSLRSVLPAVLDELAHHKFNEYCDLDEYKTLPVASQCKLMALRLRRID